MNWTLRHRRTLLLHLDLRKLVRIQQQLRQRHNLVRAEGCATARSDASRTCRAAPPPDASTAPRGDRRRRHRRHVKPEGRCSTRVCLLPGRHVRNPLKRGVLLRRVHCPNKGNVLAVGIRRKVLQIRRKLSCRRAYPSIRIEELFTALIAMAAADSVAPRDYGLVASHDNSTAESRTTKDLHCLFLCGD